MSESLKPIIFFVVILFVLGLTWYFVLYQPDVVKLEAVENQIQNLVIKFQSVSVTDQQLAALETRFNNLRQEINSTRKKIIPKEDLAVTIQQIQRQGKKFGLKFERLIPDFNSLMTIPDSQKVTPEVKKVIVHMKMQGYFLNFGRFLESLKDMPFYISLGELSILYNERIYPELDMMLDVVIYMQASLKAQAKT